MKVEEMNRKNNLFNRLSLIKKELNSLRNLYITGHLSAFALMLHEERISKKITFYQKKL